MSYGSYALPKILLSRGAFRKVCKHVYSVFDKEVIGLLIGEIVYEDTQPVVVIWDAIPGEAEASEIHVSLRPEFLAKVMNDILTGKISGRIVGWYHSHLGVGVFLSEVDARTQSMLQQFSQNVVALVVDVIQKKAGFFILRNGQPIKIPRENIQMISNEEMTKLKQQIVTKCSQTILGGKSIRVSIVPRKRIIFRRKRSSALLFVATICIVTIVLLATLLVMYRGIHYRGVSREAATLRDLVRSYNTTLFKIAESIGCGGREVELSSLLALMVKYGEMNISSTQANLLTSTWPLSLFILNATGSVEKTCTTLHRLDKVMNISSLSSTQRYLLLHTLYLLSEKLDGNLSKAVDVLIKLYRAIEECGGDLATTHSLIEYVSSSTLDAIWEVRDDEKLVSKVCLLLKLQEVNPKLLSYDVIELTLWLRNLEGLGIGWITLARINMSNIEDLGAFPLNLTLFVNGSSRGSVVISLENLVNVLELLHLKYGDLVSMGNSLVITSSRGVRSIKLLVNEPKSAVVILKIGTHMIKLGTGRSFNICIVLNPPLPKELIEKLLFGEGLLKVTINGREVSLRFSSEQTSLKEGILVYTVRSAQ
ncbi:MAG: hypothetical protein DRJ40_09135 [Thermoprotei archaeon]|nr:MAG: hypothetical protein DRJ40_09135 [Thermoprotei archaeon]